MEPVAVFHSQLSVRGQFQDGSEDIPVHRKYLSVSFILRPRVDACTVWSVVYGALESVAVLWRLRNYHDIIIIISSLLLRYQVTSRSSEEVVKMCQKSEMSSDDYKFQTSTQDAHYRDAGNGGRQMGSAMNTTQR